MIVRKLRLQRGWSQEQLAQFSGLSVRTIQRIERGKTAGLESLKSLAAVFEVTIQDLQQETTMDTNTNLSDKEIEVIEHVKDIK
ncbi:MAG TPA: XRE family transcriptional regulator, partial [Colwellia sp.]|nr:XRE family transcriptional regulator [Colwellia sp.]